MTDDVRANSTDLDLLRAEIATIWPVDDRDRIVDGPQVVIAAADGIDIAFGASVPEPLVEALRQIVARTTTPNDPAQPPAALDSCRGLLDEQLGPPSVSSGPSYLIEHELRFESDAELLRSGAANVTDVTNVTHVTDVESVRGANPGNWEADEWNDLLDGRLGPWAMALRDGRVVAICHSARDKPRGVEAGVWTHQDFRGRGHAAAVTAAWARLVLGTGRPVFYSTSAENRSSQRVAARLGLRPIGWLWKLESGRANA